MADHQPKAELKPEVSRSATGDLPWGRLALMQLAVLAVVFFATAWWAHSDWVTGQGRALALPMHGVQGKLVRHEPQRQVFLPDASGQVAVAFDTKPFLAVEKPQLEVQLPGNTGNRQYRLAWVSDQSAEPHYHLLNQPLNGISLTDLSTVENWQGRITRLGLIIEPLFPLGLLGNNSQVVEIGQARFPEATFWQAVRQQWHDWFNWQPPRYGSLNHLPYGRQLPWFATPVAVIGIGCFLTFLLAFWGIRRFSCRISQRILFSVLTASVLLVLVSVPQAIHLSHWAAQSDNKPALLSFTADETLLPVIKAVVQQPGGDQKIMLLADDYQALRLYWYLLPRNVMWFSGASEELFEGLEGGEILLIPVIRERLFNEVLQRLQALGWKAQITRAGDNWWLIRSTHRRQES